MNLDKIFPELTLKIHHIDGDMTAPWEYETTSFKCEVGTPMTFVAGMFAPFVLARAGEDNEPMRLGLYIAAGENVEGVTVTEAVNGEIDETKLVTKAKTIPIIRVQENMVLESFKFYNGDEDEFPVREKGTVVFMSAGTDDSGNMVAYWTEWNELADIAPGPLFAVIGSQLANEGKLRGENLLLRYLGYSG